MYVAVFKTGITVPVAGDNDYRVTLTRFGLVWHTVKTQIAGSKTAYGQAFRFDTTAGFTCLLLS